MINTPSLSLSKSVIQRIPHWTYALLNDTESVSNLNQLDELFIQLSHSHREHLCC